MGEHGLPLKDFVLKIPANLKPKHAAPIECAGVPTYSPMKHWKVKAGHKVGIIGMGGLEHMTTKLAKAIGADVTAFTTTKEKIKEAIRLDVIGVLEKDKKALKALASSFDLMLSKIPEKRDVNPFVALLERDRTVAVEGALEWLAAVNNQAVAVHRRSVVGSLIGNLADTQEVPDFCAERNIGPDVQFIPIQDINDTFKTI